MKVYPHVFIDADGVLIGSLPEECVRDCTQPGPNDESVSIWRTRLDFTVPRDRAIEYLASTGGWTREELSLDTDNDTLADRILWTACHEEKESGFSGIM